MFMFWVCQYWFRGFSAILYLAISWGTSLCRIFMKNRPFFNYSNVEILDDCTHASIYFREQTFISLMVSIFCIQYLNNLHQFSSQRNPSQGIFIDTHHLPEQEGFLFSAKALKPSFLSSECTILSQLNLQISSPVRKSTSTPQFMALFACLTPNGPLGSIYSIKETALFQAYWKFYYVQFTIPSSLACYPFSLRAVKINYLALATPMVRANVCVPPAPGIKLQQVQGKPINEFLVAIRISALSANSKPPPRAGPSMTQMTGQ